MRDVVLTLSGPNGRRAGSSSLIAGSASTALAAVFAALAALATALAVLAILAVLAAACDQTV
tara:strand:- start:223 stop:408 length:186 start_codon:yes stop_codon:yes gene_type:complete